MSGKVVIYGDALSQPVRASWWLALLINVPNFEFKLTQIGKREHQSEEYTKINPMQKVPALNDDGFLVNESHTIMRYLVEKYAKGSQWYPTDLKHRAQVDMYLDWCVVISSPLDNQCQLAKHHSNLRFGAAGYFRTVFFATIMGQTPDPRRVAAARKAMIAALKALDSVFLSNNENGNKPFITGSQPTIADLSAFEEVKELELVDVDISEYKNILAWMERVRQMAHYDKVHKFFDSFNSRRKSKL